MESLAEFGYPGLFLAAFVSATLFPGGSELVLSALLLGGLSPALLVAIATVGNVLGSLLNYALGYWGSKEVVKRWLRMSDADFVRAEQRFVNYGLFSLLFAWMPIIGDPITVAAGILRIRLRWFLLLVTAGKLLRYIVVAYFALQVAPG